MSSLLLVELSLGTLASVVAVPPTRGLLIHVQRTQRHRDTSWKSATAEKNQKGSMLKSLVFKNRGSSNLPTLKAVGSTHCIRTPCTMKTTLNGNEETLRTARTRREKGEDPSPWTHEPAERPGFGPSCRKPRR